MPSRIQTLVRYGLLGVNHVAMRGLRAVARHARKLEIGIDGIGDLAVAPLVDIPIPTFDLGVHEDPLLAIIQDARYRETVSYFKQHASTTRSLLPVDAQALLYIVARNLRPDHVVEIGVFRAATTEAIARALHANRHGIVHAVDPYRTEYIEAIFKRWPPELLAHLSFHPSNSVQFFDELKRSHVRTSLVLIDGNHDYEFASFDLESTSRIIAPGGFIFLDNITLPGPFFAVQDFLARHSGWTECGGSIAGCDRTKAYDNERTRIPDTDLAVLRAPRHLTISGRPWSPGQARTSISNVTGIRIKVERLPGPGTLHVQVILRGFGARPDETAACGSVQLESSDQSVSVVLTPRLKIAGDFTHLTVEPYLMWHGPQPLQLARIPEVF